MYEQANNWVIELCSLFDPTRILTFIVNFWNKQGIGTHYPNDTKIRGADVLIAYMILFWAMLYSFYQKCLNSLFRRMCFSLSHRSSIIKAIWNCGFCFGSICYMRSSETQILNYIPYEQGMTYQELGVVLHKSFYIHQAALDILYHGGWMRGCANLFFALFVLNPYQQNHRWCTITSSFLMCKTIDNVIINICQILLLVYRTAGTALCKMLFLLHCLCWIYLYLYYVLVSMIWLENTNYTKLEPTLWLWFLTECFDSVWFKAIFHVNAAHWLEICLFPSPTAEAVQLTKIYKRHKEFLTQSKSTSVRKAQLWQTVLCAMAIKKKVRRLREAKRNNIGLTLEDLQMFQLNTTSPKKHILYI